MEVFRLDFGFGLQAGKMLAEVVEGNFPEELLPLKEKIEQANKNLLEGTAPGNDFLGWVNLPAEITDTNLQEILSKAEEFRTKSQVFVCVGIGGSYLGTRAVLEALKPQLSTAKKGAPTVIYAGHHLSEDYTHELLELLDNVDYTLCVISKSGTTTEPAVAFRLLRAHMENKYGKGEARKRIVAITDKEKGALKTLADEEGYTTYVVPDNVGGRYSVLTPVGLFPLAVAGVNITDLVAGAKDKCRKLTSAQIDWTRHSGAQYALYRQYLYTVEGKKVELMVNFDPRFFYLSEWWKQLYGESEGKQHKGLFPSSAGFTTDLHSLGQYIQDGERLFLETVLSLENCDKHVEIPSDESNLDGMNFLAGKRISYVNAKAEEGTCLAHSEEGGVPVLRIQLSQLNEYAIGQLIYFFEYACGLSGYAMDVNPFDQPGVEAYKKNMFRLLGK